MGNDPGSAKRARVRGGLIALVVLAAGAVLLWRAGSSPETSEQPAETLAEGLFIGMDLWETEPLAWESEPAAMPRTKRSSARSELTPAEVIDNPDCGLRHADRRGGRFRLGDGRCA